MRIRFRHTAASASPDQPFQPGQIIEVAAPTPELLRYLEYRDGRAPVAEVLPEEESVAVVVPDERAVVVRKRKR